MVGKDVVDTTAGMTLDATRAVIGGIGVAHPAPVSQDELWRGFFAGQYAGVAKGLAKRVFEHAGVVTRHAAVNPLIEDVSQWSTGQRMTRYLAEALPLGKDAVSAALGQAGVAATDIGLMVACSCTGYVTPGLDILLARDLGFPADTQRIFVGHMGCYAAVPSLGVAADYVRLHGRPAVVLCVELTSLHVQPPTVDPQQVVAHALFSDAAAALVVVPSGAAPGAIGPAVRDIASLTDTTTADHMTWHVTDLGFRMGLSTHVPDVLSRHVAHLVTGQLERNGLTVADVGAWAVHPGGPRILQVVEQQLGLAPDALTASRACLAESGNCSSPTVLMILDRLLRETPGPVPRGGDRPLVMMAFGPGLTLYSALLI
jgi:predicted naringenin-chalcone synthase